MSGLATSRCQAILIGGGVEARTPRRGVVHSVFRRAVNLLIDGNLWTVHAEAGQVAHFSIVLSNAPSAWELSSGDTISVRAGFVGIGSTVIDTRMAPTWSPEPWPVPGAGTPARSAAARRRARVAAWPGAPGLADDLSAALRFGPRALDEAVMRLIGRGPGLTPSGDDILAGFLTVAARFVEAAPLRQLSGAIARHAHHTGEISRHLLTQAMQGHLGRPLHELGLAILSPDLDLDAALTRLLAVGATSGADGCLGLTAALDLCMQYDQRHVA